MSSEEAAEGAFPVWCAVAEGLDACRQAARDKVIVLLGDGLRGEVTVSEFVGQSALDALKHVEICVTSFIRSIEARRTATGYIEGIERLLCDKGGMLVIAKAMGVPPAPLSEVEEMEELTRDAAWEHVSGIMFDSMDRPEADCIMCQAGDRTGAWAHFTGMSLAGVLACAGDE